MKKRLKRGALFLMLLTLFTFSATAKEADLLPQNEQVNAEYAAFLESIPPEVAELLPEDFFQKSLSDTEQSIQKGGSVSAILSAVAKLTGLAIRENLALLAKICGILLLSAVFRALAAGSEKRGVGAALHFCSALAMTCLLLSMQQDTFLSLDAYFNTVKGLSVGFLPLMSTLYAMGGNVRAAVVNHSVMSAFLTLLETFCAGTVLPIAGICLALTLTEAISGRLTLRPLSGLIKRTYTLCISFLMLLLCGVLGLQSTLAKASDSLALRTARFAAGSFLPVVGGSVSESLRTVAGSVEYLRAVAGTGAILVLFFAFLPIFLSVLLTRIAFLLGGAAAKLLSCDAEEKLLSELASVYGYFLAIIACVFVMMVFSLTLFARCAAAG